MCLSSQQTRETRGGDNIAKTQTQTFPCNILDAVSPQQNEITNEGEEWLRDLFVHSTFEKTSSAASLRCACCRFDQSQVPCCWVEHSEIKTVRTGVTCVTLRSCQVLSTPLYIFVLPHRISKQCHYTAVLIAENKWKSQCLVVFCVPRVHCVTVSPLPPCLAYLYNSGIWLLWQWLRLILLSAGYRLEELEKDGGREWLSVVGLG